MNHRVLFSVKRAGFAPDQPICQSIPSVSIDILNEMADKETIGSFSEPTAVFLRWSPRPATGALAMVNENPRREAARQRYRQTEPAAARLREGQRAATGPG